MNRLIIIGNGFDLAHGLQTSYKSFLEWVLGWHLKQAIDSPESDYESEDLRYYIPTIKSMERAKKAKTLDDFRRIMRIDSANLINEVRRHSFQSVREDMIGDQTIAIIKNGILADWIYGSFDNWVDLEWLYFKKLLEFGRNFNGKTHRIKKFQEEFKRIELALIGYLRTISSQSKIAGISSLITDRFTAKARLSRTPMIKYNSTFFVNFNYTKTLDLYEEEIYSINGKIFNIHGSIDDNEVIFGFGDDNHEEYNMLESLNENIMLKYSKSIKYLQRSCYANFIGRLEEEYDVEIWGHSCGITDRTLLKIIFEHDNCRAIVPYYFVNDEGVSDFNEIVTNISRSFSDKNLFRSRVFSHPLCRPLPQKQK